MRHYIARAKACVHAHASFYSVSVLPLSFACISSNSNKLLTVESCQFLSFFSYSSQRFETCYQCYTALPSGLAHIPQSFLHSSLLYVDVVRHCTAMGINPGHYGAGCNRSSEYKKLSCHTMVLAVFLLLSSHTCSCHINNFLPYTNLLVHQVMLCRTPNEAG